ncbi:TetR/AcrR family transcriptional regulator [Streptomyces sp. CoT10]|uniref:TetR/AcrR family transcriptional regulator n=1 Tax=Streptomyces sp. CoT10 TaxID=2875762 RepID=UPI001CD811C7|nr:TetR/AcrR family transcriptional regulator [Streptomyces sp. CoT10]
MTPQASGRRERKKAATRTALADAASRLFLERGYDGVTVAEVADEADMAVATLFAHFPAGKEALIFDDGIERRETLAAAITERPAGTSALDALEAYLARRGAFDESPSPEGQQRRDLIISTPALRAHARSLWMGCESILTELLAQESGRDPQDVSLRLLARYVLELPDLIGADHNSRKSLETAFDHLRRGWPDL